MDIAEFSIFIGILVAFAAILLIVNKVKRPKEE